MDGKEIVQTFVDVVESNQLPNNLREDKRIIYKYADLAVQKWCDHTGYLVKTGTVTTVDGTQVYDLPYDFLRVFTKDENYEGVVKYYDTEEYYFPKEVDFQEIFTDNLTDEYDHPLEYSLYKSETRAANITGAVDSTGSLTNGETKLNDTTGLFLTTNLVHIGDTVHNSTDGSDGIILTVTDASNLQCALFGGATNCFTSADTYVIVRNPLWQIYLDAPSSTSGHTITIPYVSRAVPVYSDYGYWNIPQDAAYAVVCEAVFMYLTRMAPAVRAGQFHKVFQESVWSYTRYLPHGKMRMI